MGETTDRMKRPVPEGEERPEEIREDIEQTRAEMSQTIDEIAEQLSPDHLKQEARQAVRERTIGRVQQAASTTTERARQASSQLVDRSKQVASQVQAQVRPVTSKAQEATEQMQRVRQENPQLVTAAAVGLVLAVAVLISLRVMRVRRAKSERRSTPDVVEYIRIARRRQDKPRGRWR